MVGKIQGAGANTWCFGANVHKPSSVEDEMDCWDKYLNTTYCKYNYYLLVGTRLRQKSATYEREKAVSDPWGR